MYDFDQVFKSSKDEQIRAWAIERAVESGAADGVSIVKRADMIESFIKNGKQESNE